MWQETVMSDQNLKELIEKLGRAPSLDESWEAQAEITWKAREVDLISNGWRSPEHIKEQLGFSFKAGEVAGYKRGLEMREPYLEGIRKVVEWIRQYAIHGKEVKVGDMLEDMRTHSEFGIVLKNEVKGE